MHCQQAICLTLGFCTLPVGEPYPERHDDCRLSSESLSLAQPREEGFVKSAIMDSLARDSTRNKRLTLSSSRKELSARHSERELNRSTSMILRDFIVRADVNSTIDLVNAYNSETDKEERDALYEWMEHYVMWFTDRKDAYLKAGIVEEYAVLTRIDPQEPRDARLVKDILSSLAGRAEGERLGNDESTAALNNALQAVDAAVFAGNPALLLDLASVLLSKLDPANTSFTKETYSTHEATLLALHHVFLLVREVAPNQLHPDYDDGFFQKMKKALENVSAQSCYFPIRFHVEVAKQSLKRLALKVPSDVLRALKHGIKGFLYLYRGARRALVAEIDYDALERAYKELKEACSNQRISERRWYDELMKLNIVTQLSLGDTTGQSSFVDCFETLMKDQYEISYLEDRKLLAFGIIRQLQLLVADGKPRTIREIALDEIAQLALIYTQCDECYGDPDIVETLLDSLLHIHAIREQQDESQDILRRMLEDGRSDV